MSVEAACVQVDGVDTGHVEEVRGKEEAAAAGHPAVNLLVVAHIAVITRLSGIGRYCTWGFLK